MSAAFETCFFRQFSSFNNKSCKYTIRDNGNNVQSHYQEESKFNSTINANSGAHTFMDDKIIKTRSKHIRNVAEIKYGFVFNSCYVILIEQTFYYFAICKCIGTTACVNSIAQLTFFLVMRLNITIATNFDSLIAILVP